MKRILSTWMAAARGLLWKLLLIVLVMAAAEIGMYRYHTARVVQLLSDVGLSINFGYLLNEAKIPYVFFFALVAVSAICVLQGCRFSGKNIYTLQRLPLGEWQTTLLWSVVHGMCFVILWAAQLVMAFVLWRLFAAQYGSANPGLELFVEFYGNGFLHGLLPMAEISRWVFVICYYLTLAVTTACFGFFQRRGRFRLEVCLVLMAYALTNANLGSTTGDWVCVLGCAAFVAFQLFAIWEVYHSEETD